MAGSAMDQNLTNSSTQAFAASEIDALLYSFRSDVIPLSISIGVVATLGLFGNLSVLIVYSRKLPQTNFRYFVLSMAVVDFISCVTTLPAEIYSQLNWYSYHVDALCRIKCFFNVFTVWGSACVLHILAYDRYRKVSRPLAWQIQPSQALKLCVVSMCTAVIVAIPAAVYWGQRDFVYEYEGRPVNVSICEKSSEYSDDIYPFIYAMIVYIAAVGVMVFVMTVLNILTAKALFFDKNRPTILKTFSKSLTTASFCTSESSVQLSKFTKSSSDNSRINTGDLNNSLTTFRNPSATTLSDLLENRIKRCCCCGKNAMGDLCVKTKSIIMFVLSFVFAVTVLIYLIMSTLTAHTGNIMRTVSSSHLVRVFVLWRLYFMNCLINPITYGFSDPRFRRGLRGIFKK